VEIQSTKLANAVVLKLSGHLDAENAPLFQSACEQWISKGGTHLLLEFSDLQYVSSMGLSSFMAIAKSLQPKSGAVMLCQLRGLPKQVFEFTRLIDLFPCSTPRTPPSPAWSELTSNDAAHHPRAR
jgi:anti-anti-sigma factor